MKKYAIIFLTPIVIFAIGLFVIVPYYQNQKIIKRYAFTMDSIHGKVSLSDFKGKVPIIYFGYMDCPDICPTTLAMISGALHKFSKKDAQKFQLIFISVDPDRDKVKGLKEYASYFYPTAIGVTSNAKYLKKVSANYGAYYKKIYLKGSKIGYSVAHTSFIYVMDESGKLAKRLSHPDSAEPIYKALKDML
jgi:protein SCO1/2